MKINKKEKLFIISLIMSFFPTELFANRRYMFRAFFAMEDLMEAKLFDYITAILNVISMIAVLMVFITFVLIVIDNINFKKLKVKN